MSERRPVEIEALPLGALGPSAPLWWGMIGLIVVESMVFASLIASYFYFRVTRPEWPPAGVGAPELVLPTINTVILLASAVPMHWADQGAMRGEQRAVRLGLTISIALAAAFLGVKAFEFGHLEYRWSTHVYGSVFWTISGFHAAHVIALVLKTSVIAAVVWRHDYYDGERLPLEVNGLYWHFVVIVWLPLYGVLYVTPNVV